MGDEPAAQPQRNGAAQRRQRADHSKAPVLRRRRSPGGMGMRRSLNGAVPRDEAERAEHGTLPVPRT
ncbi:hypothetical protein [Streptomyces sp. NBC_00483]|uniref:hypothetical protein n=1 Tax=Streptomyces sp. NBC_00483 TaxID=2975756 RepID=UPI002E17EB3A